VRTINLTAVYRGRIDFARDSLGKLRSIESAFQQRRDGVTAALTLLEREWPTIEADGTWVAEHTDQSEVAELCVQYALFFTKDSLDPEGIHMFQRPEVRQNWEYVLYKPATEAGRAILGENSSSYASIVKGLATVYQQTGRLIEAERLCREAFEVDLRVYGDECPTFVANLRSRVSVYLDMGRPEEAEPLSQQALEVARKHGAGDRVVGMCLHDLGTVNRMMRRFEEAEGLYLPALEIAREYKHTEMVADILDDLAALYIGMGRLEEAEPLYREALEIRYRQGRKRPAVGLSLYALGELYRKMGRLGEAEWLYWNAWEVCRPQLGKGHFVVEALVMKTSELYREMGRHEDAEKLTAESADRVSQGLIARLFDRWIPCEGEGAWVTSLGRHTMHWLDHKQELAKRCKELAAERTQLEAENEKLKTKIKVLKAIIGVGEAKVEKWKAKIDELKADPNPDCKES
jgi:tetratricopeptide (TPR) repeat protein